MKELFDAFVNQPSRESFMALRGCLVKSKVYRPDTQEQNWVDALLEKNELEQAKKALGDAMPNLLLSPRAHLSAALLHHKLGDEAAAQAEGRLAAQCCAGIMSTGKGTEAEPYLVTRVSDEYDLLQFLGKEFTRQAVVHRDGRHLDRLICADGSEVWFDVTDLYEKGTERIRGLAAKESPEEKKTP